METPLPRLHATPPAPLPFMRGVVVRSFVLERAQGNVIIYNAPGLTTAADEIAALGRPERLLVNHWHEAMYGTPALDVPIFVHERDRAQTDLPIAGTFAGRERIGDDLELIPTPGHTAGATMFLWDNGTERVLFPGDTIWVRDGEWQAVVLGDSDRDAYLASLALIGDLDFDVLVPWGSMEDQPYSYRADPAQRREQLGRIIERLRQGEDQ